MGIELHGKEYRVTRLNESPSEKEGKCLLLAVKQPKAFGLNESPSEKEGKFKTQASFEVWPPPQ